jgi:hypothetical protein
MIEYCFVIVNNAGHSWAALKSTDPDQPKDMKSAALPQLLAEGWVPVRETPMGGGTSPLAHSLVLLERKPPVKAPRAAAKRS